MENVRPNYLKALFFHENNLYAAAAAVAAAGIISMPYNTLGIIPLLGFLAVQAGMYWGDVANTPAWRNHVDERERKAQRTASRTRLLADLTRYSDLNICKHYLHQYRLMCERVEAMYSMAKDSRTNISVQDVDRFNDTTVSYLSLLYAWLNADAGLAQQRLSEAQDNIAKIEMRLRKEAAMAIGERANLLRALGDYKGVIERSTRRESRLLTIQASLNTLPDKLEEVYQMLSASPYSNDMSQRIEESLNTMLLQEEVDSLVEAEIASLGSPQSISTKTPMSNKKTSVAQPLSR